ncbi:WG repeat-containing protein [Aureivirga sp. CE67]|uniref:WG repeat-containing protein n=1 Tax=Aureivirga sp. CE67 TaxID=1788983 RepID=UPI0018CB8179|nr:WG repeat-containing protein [Aureivirga sp. CE67]
MKKNYLLLFTILTFGYISNIYSQHQSDEELFLFTENDLKGYIDETGREAIKPKFLNAKNFSEGLAVANLDGLYGFIDKNGKFVIEPEFEDAYSFRNGIAKIYKSNQLYFIDKTGTILFEHDFKNIFYSGEKNVLITQSKTNKFGLIDYQGNIKVKNIHDFIGYFIDGQSIVRSKKEEGIMDTNGNFVSPLGKYLDISYAGDFYSAVLSDNGKNEDFNKVIINQKDEIMLIENLDEWMFNPFNMNFSENLASVIIFEEIDDIFYESIGVVDGNGKIIFKNNLWKDISVFKNGVAFVKKNDSTFDLINNKGEKLNKESFLNIAKDFSDINSHNFFENKMEFVLTENGWGAIDSKGNFVKEPRRFDFIFNKVKLIKNYVLFIRYYNSKTELTGFWNLKTNTIVPPKFDKLDIHPDKKIFHVEEFNSEGYINSEGEYIWNEKFDKGKAQSLGLYNIEGQMNSEYRLTKRLLNSSEEKIMKKHKLFKPNEINLFVDTNEIIRFNNKYKGLKLYLSNDTENIEKLYSIDDRIYLTIQAKDKNGNWKDLQKPIESTCANSYLNIRELPAKSSYGFVIPLFEGTYETELRVRFNLNKNNISLYSNIYKGKVNPSQLKGENLNSIIFIKHE